MTLVLALAVAGQAHALINPRFTPIHLVEQSQQILLLRLARPDGQGRVAAEVLRAVKGEAAARKLVIDLASAPGKEQARAIQEVAARLGDGPALLFVGQDEAKDDAAFLHLCGRWLRLDAGKAAGAWEMRALDVGMEGTWAGGTDMLLGVVEYILQNPGEATVPVAVGLGWAGRMNIATVKGEVLGAQAVDLAGEGRDILFIAAAEGDRLFEFDRTRNAFVDVTGKRRLASRSRRAAWGDLDGDGRLDLVSWDGQALRLWHQSAAGGFGTESRGMPVQLKGGCRGLSILDVGLKGRPGILVSGDGAPLLLRPTGDGAFQPGLLPAGATEELGPAGGCLVADLDGDGQLDVLQPGASRSLLFKGRGGGQFAAPVPCAVALGKGRSGAFLGDFDHDGRLDVWAYAEDRCRLWQNRGARGFEEVMTLSGETAYYAMPGAVCGITCDINNDGRQDTLMAYRERPALIFFNRGFRSFGKALELTREDVIPETAEGQQAGTIGDFNRDGAQDMALVLKSGVVRVFLRQVFDGEAPLALRAALPLGGDVAGPVTVTGWADARCLGAWNVVAGSSEAFFGRSEPGEVTLKWRFPGGTEQTRAVALERKAVRVVLRPER
ncbi:MAG TPA: VCBS repeat-containing protein [Planctomycetota bacterium]|nr:VCBS repeat-containing protein [Planctomycetota bacterium]